MTSWSLKQGVYNLSLALWEFSSLQVFHLSSHPLPNTLGTFKKAKGSLWPWLPHRRLKISGIVPFSLGRGPLISIPKTGRVQPLAGALGVQQLARSRLVGQQPRVSHRGGLDPAPHTPHPTPNTLHHTPIHPTLHNLLHPTLYTLHLTPYTLLSHSSLVSLFYLHAKAKIWP